MLIDHCHPVILVVKLIWELIETIATDVLSVVARDHYICKIQCNTRGVRSTALQLLIPTGYQMLYGWMTHQKGPPVAYLYSSSEAQIGIMSPI